MATLVLKVLAVATIWSAWVAVAPIPVVALADLIQDSDVVVVGRVATVVEHEPVVMPGGGSARNLVGTIFVDDVIKGVVRDSSVRIRFVQPDEPVGFRSVVRDTYGLFFLRRSSSGAEFTSPYYPYLIALPGFRASGQSPTDRAIDVVSNVLRSDASAANQIEAIWALRGSRHPIAIAALQRSTRNTDREIALRSAAALLSVGDTSGLPVVANTLEGSRAGLSDEAYLTVLGSVAELNQPAAAATLDRLLARGDAGTRRAAIQSLRKLRSPGAVSSLVRALDDDDLEVRHHAVMALAELTERNEWGPSIDAFTEDERRYITYWKEWVKQRK
jgi:hypothetical protein